MILDVEGLTTTTTTFFVGIAEDEPFFHLGDLIIHFCSKNEHHGFWVNQDFHAILKLDNFLKATGFVGIFQRVGQARTPFAAHTKPDAFGRLAAAIKQRLDMNKRF